MNSAVTSAIGATSGSRWTTVWLCLMAAILEGFDLQSAGVAGPGLRAAFGLDPSQLGLVFSASILGLLPGAMIGGRLADLYGRKQVLIGSMLLFGFFSIATALSWDYQTLLLARFLTGLGMGGAMPNLIALSAESVKPKSRNIAVAIMYAGMPFGGLLASIIALVFGATWGWHVIFYFGGIAPLVVAPVLYFLLPESQQFEQRKAAATAAADREGMLAALFGGGRATPTMLLWLAYFFTLIVLYFLQNWLPTVVIGAGFTREAAGTVQIAFNIGGILGSLGTGYVMDRGPRKTGVALVYIGLIASMMGLAYTKSFTGLILGGFGGGMFSIGGQMVLYGLAPIFYHTLIRGTGVGAAVAVGRMGSVVGPLAAGQLLSAGSGTTAVIAATFPGIVIAAIAAQGLLFRKSTAD
jgi:MFS transporter, AAHS family, 3-hydroxyphenylpropionic acid transporter